MRYTKDTKKSKSHPNEGCAAKEICYDGHCACCLHCALSCCHGRHDREGHERLIDSFFHLSIRIAISRSPNRRLYCALPVVFYVSDSTHTPAFPARQESPADRFAIPRPGRPLNFLVQRAVFHARRNVRRSQLHCASAGRRKLHIRWLLLPFQTVTASLGHSLGRVAIGRPYGADWTFEIAMGSL